MHWLGICKAYSCVLKKLFIATKCFWGTYLGSSPNIKFSKNSQPNSINKVLNETLLHQIIILQSGHALSINQFIFRFRQNRNTSFWIYFILLPYSNFCSLSLRKIKTFDRNYLFLDGDESNCCWKSDDLI